MSQICYGENMIFHVKFVLFTGLHDIIIANQQINAKKITVSCVFTERHGKKPKIVIFFPDYISGYGQALIKR